MFLGWSGVFIQFNRWNWRINSTISICQNRMAIGIGTDNNISIHQLYDSDVCHRNNGLCKCNLLLGPIRTAETWTRTWRRTFLWLYDNMFPFWFFPYLSNSISVHWLRFYGNFIINFNISTHILSLRCFFFYHFRFDFYFVEFLYLHFCFNRVCFICKQFVDFRQMQWFKCVVF